MLPGTTAVPVCVPGAGPLPETTAVPVAFAGVVEVSTGITTTTVVGLGAQPDVQSLEVVVKTGAMLLEVTSAGQYVTVCVIVLVVKPVGQTST